jgi:hypothetical protein
MPAGFVCTACKNCLRVRRYITLHAACAYNNGSHAYGCICTTGTKLHACMSGSVSSCLLCSCAGINSGVNKPTTRCRARWQAHGSSTCHCHSVHGEGQTRCNPMPAPLLPVVMHITPHMSYIMYPVVLADWHSLIGESLCKNQRGRD